MALVAALWGASACSTLKATIGSYEVGRDGISRPQQRLREALSHADFAVALGWSEDDALLHALNMGVSSYYASQFARSAAVLDSAALLADDRITASISKDALSMITNDLARPYQPRRTERLFISYYGMLSYARLDRWEDAAVEARRLSALLAEYATDRNDSEQSTHGALHYLAGAVFERAGEKQEAQVAYRLARSLMPAADSVLFDRASNDGEVLVVVERGFVAHRATESINVFLDDDDRDSLRSGDRDHTRSVAERIAIAASDGSRDRRRGRKHGRDRDDDDDGYWLSVAFPSMRRAPYHSVQLDAFVDGVSAASSRVATLVDDAIVADERRERTGIIARAVVRAAAKYAVTKAVKDKKGEVAGTIANIGASLLERADVRSWHLLPQEITLMRMHAPTGPRRIELALNADASRVDLGPVNVRAGQIAIAAVRIWQNQAPRVVAAK